MTAAVVHQLAAEGRFRLDGRISDLLPASRFPPAMNHRPGSARSCVRAALRRPACPAGRPVDRLSGRRALALFQHRLRDPWQARRACLRRAAGPTVRGPHLQRRRHDPQPRRNHRCRQGAIRSGIRSRGPQRAVRFRRAARPRSVGGRDVGRALRGFDRSRHDAFPSNALGDAAGPGRTRTVACARLRVRPPRSAERYARDDLRQRVDARRLCRPILSSSYRRDGQLFLVVSPRRSQRRSRVRLRQHKRLRRIPAAPADLVRRRGAGRCSRRAGRSRRRHRSQCPWPMRRATSAAIRDRTARSKSFRRAADHHRQWPLGRASAVGRRAVPDHPSGFPRVHSDVRAAGPAIVGASWGATSYARAGQASSSRRPIRHLRGSPANM